MKHFPLLIMWLLAANLICAAPKTTGTLILDPNTDLKGENITLNVEEESIATVLKLLSLARGVNIVAGSEVTGTVTVNLYNTPFDQALTAILGISGFTHFEKDGIIYVTSESAMSKLPLGTSNRVTQSFRINHAQPDELLTMVTEFLSPSGKAILSTQERTIVVQDAPEYVSAAAALIAQQDQPTRAPNLEVRSFRVDFASPEEILALVEKMISKNGKATLNLKQKSILVQDAPEYVSMVEEAITTQDIPARQVMISVEIIRISRDDTLTVGTELQSTKWDSGEVDYSKTGTVDDFAYNLTDLNNAGDGMLIGNLATGAEGLLWTAIWKNKEAIFSALSSKGDIEILATPELLALDGEEARMIIGDKLGYKTFSRADDGTTFEKVEFLDTGTQLTVTPEICRDGLVQMKIFPQVSSGQVKDNLPAANTTEVETTLMVRNGETIVIGGLINILKERVRTQVPFIGDIPVIGLLFGFNTWRETQTELVILITPHIIGPDSSPNKDVKIENYSKFSLILPEDFLRTFEFEDVDLEPTSVPTKKVIQK